jgi:hypothetical protein
MELKRERRTSVRLFFLRESEEAPYKKNPLSAGWKGGAR